MNLHFQSFRTFSYIKCTLSAFQSQCLVHLCTKSSISIALSDTGACSKYRPCQNGGNCTDIDTKNRTYSCACPLDYEGKNCAKKIIPCESNPCLNGGACENIPSRGNLPPTFKCTCVGDFTGQKCETLMGMWFSSFLQVQSHRYIT